MLEILKNLFKWVRRCCIFVESNNCEYVIAVNAQSLINENYLNQSKGTRVGRLIRALLDQSQWT